MEWQLIETAPKDGSPVLLFSGREVTVGAYRGDFPEHKWTVFDADLKDDPINGWSDNKHGPTHWMPLPEAPNS